METFNAVMGAINEVIWHDFVLYIVLGVGVLFTIWTKGCQVHALTHGTTVIRGKYDKKDAPGAISHFQALSAALSATVGLGNIGGVAVAVALGGPGAIFWMWMIGLAGMALKTTEVTLSMLYRNTDKPDEPHGGPMWVAAKGLAERGYPKIGKLVGGIFCVTLLISAFTGGNMFQAWNVGIVTRDAFGIPTMVTGAVMAIVVATVIIGGIKRIGSVAEKLVPFMCGTYLIAAVFVLIANIGVVPEMIALIFKHAFAPASAQGAFVGGTFGFAFLWGMKRALFSSESGQGSSPIAHSAARTSEPVREAVVAGLEPFIDTLVVCTLTSLVILSTGAWNRSGEAMFADEPAFSQVAGGKWTLGTTPLPARNEEARRVVGDWKGGEMVFALARHGEPRKQTNDNLYRVSGNVTKASDGQFLVIWDAFSATEPPKLASREIHREYPGAALTALAFDRAAPGWGTFLVLFASWLFAISTMISWSYYGEQGMVFLAGEKSVLPYKIVYCILVIVATAPFMKTDAELDNLTGLGTGVMLWANIPIMLFFGATAMKAYHSYIARLKAGEFEKNA